MTLLSDTFYLGRSSRYGNPLNGNDRLPIVYGDVSDGTNGNWILPCINTVDFVYCFSAREVLSVGNGNSINVYAGGSLVDPADYAFDEKNDYESLGDIAIVDFTADQGNAVISARGKGKPTASGGATLLENIVDIINDFLTVENDFTSALYEATSKARSSAVFESESYKAAGVIHQDIKIWDLLVQMMGSFLGSIFLNGAGDLYFDIDNNEIVQYGPALIISKSEIKLLDAKQRLVNLINQCPCNYAYDYVTGEFRSETDTAAQADSASQNIYGTRKPSVPYQFYWCRDLTSVQAVQSIIVDKFAEPLFEIEIEDQTSKRVGLDILDFFACSIDSLYDDEGQELLNHLWKTISVKPDFGKSKNRIRALQTDYYMYALYLADGSYEADGSIRAGGNRDVTPY